MKLLQSVAVKKKLSTVYIFLFNCHKLLKMALFTFSYLFTLAVVLNGSQLCFSNYFFVRNVYSFTFSAMKSCLESYSFSSSLILYKNLLFLLKFYLYVCAKVNFKDGSLGTLRPVCAFASIKLLLSFCNSLCISDPVQ